MNLHFYIFDTETGNVFYPNFLLTKTHRQREDLLVFHFPDVIFMVQDTLQNLDEIQLCMQANGGVNRAMKAQMVERSAFEDK